MVKQANTDGMASSSFLSDCGENCDLTAGAKECFQDMQNMKREVRALQQRFTKIRAEAAGMLAEFASLHDPLMRVSLALAHQDYNIAVSGVEQINSAGFIAQNQSYQLTSDISCGEMSSDAEGALKIVTDSSSADDSAAQEGTELFSEVNVVAEGDSNITDMEMVSSNVGGILPDLKSPSQVVTTKNS